MNQPTDRPGRQPVFHEKRTYRIRRLMDAARIAPLLALSMWLIPLVWPQSGEGRITTATAMIYIFAVWAVVIIVAFGLSFWLARIEGNDTDPDQ